MTDGVNGLLFETENSTDLSKKILYLYENKNLILEFGSKLQEDIFAKFSLKIMMKKYLDVYEGLLSN